VGNLDDMGVSKLSAKVFLKVNYLVLAKKNRSGSPSFYHIQTTKALERNTLVNTSSQVEHKKYAW